MSKTNSDTALKLLKSNKEQGRMKIDNPEELMEKLTQRYGDNAPDLVVRAIKEPSTLMGEIGQKGTTSAKALEYLAGDKISPENIQTLGGTIEQSAPAFTLEPVGKTSETAQNVASASEQTSAPQVDLSQIGNVDVYGNQIRSSESDNSSSASSDNNATNQDNDKNSSSYANPWEELFSNLMSGDLGKMLGAALTLQMLNQTHLAFGPHYTPFPYHCHPYRDRIDHFDHCVDNRSKTEKVLDKVADVAHGVAGVTHGVGHIIDAINGDRRR